MRSFAVPAVLLLAVVVVLGALVWVKATEEAEPAVVPRPAVQPVVPAPQTFQPATRAPEDVISGDRYLQVGVEIMPGVWQTEGVAEGASTCRWERLRDTEEGEESVAEKSGTGPMTVLVKGTDDRFSTSGCKPWRPAN